MNLIRVVRFPMEGTRCQEETNIEGSQTKPQRRTRHGGSLHILLSDESVVWPEHLKAYPLHGQEDLARKLESGGVSLP